MAEGGSTWSKDVRSSQDVADKMQWVRWLANGRQIHGAGLLMIAIGSNSIAISRDERMSPRELMDLLEVEKQTIATLLEKLQAERKTHGATPRMKL